MERRRFILDAITHCPSQSIADELSELRKARQSSSGSSHKDSESVTGGDTSLSRSKRAAARRHKLEALKHRHQVEVRFQALEKVFERNNTSKVRGIGCISTFLVRVANTRTNLTMYRC